MKKQIQNISKAVSNFLTPWRIFSGIYVGSLIVGILYKIIWGH
jgi:hypothetical protein